MLLFRGRPHHSANPAANGASSEHDPPTWGCSLVSSCWSKAGLADPWAPNCIKFMLSHMLPVLSICCPALYVFIVYTRGKTTEQSKEKETPATWLANAARWLEAMVFPNRMSHCAVPPVLEEVVTWTFMILSVPTLDFCGLPTWWAKTTMRKQWKQVWKHYLPEEHLRL